MQPHAGDHEQIGDSAIEPHSRGPKFLVPLLEDDAGFLKTAIDHRRSDAPYAGRGHSRVGKDEWEHSGAMIEGAGDDRNQIVTGGESAQPFADAVEFPRPQ